MRRTEKRAPRPARVAVVTAPRRAGRDLLGLAFATLALALLLVGQAQAADLQATNLRVSVWPEYDDPRVLVIMQGELDPSTPLPATVSFNVPKGAEIGMTCEIQPDGGHACKPFQTKDNGDYLTISFQVESQRNIFTEYYHQSYTAGTPARAFDFVFKPAFAAKSVQLEVQEPARATGFTLDPAFSQTAKDASGLTYHLKDYADVQAGQDIAVKVAYTKNDNETSVKPKDQSSAGAAGPAASSEAGAPGNSSLLYVLGVLGFAAVLFGGYKVFRPAAAGASVGRSSSGRAPAAKAAPGNQRKRSSASAHKFCTACGSRLSKQDLFCSSCGQPQV